MSVDSGDSQDARVLKALDSVGEVSKEPLPGNFRGLDSLDTTHQQGSGGRETPPDFDG